MSSTNWYGMADYNEGVEEHYRTHKAQKTLHEAKMKESMREQPPRVRPAQAGPSSQGARIAGGAAMERYPAIPAPGPGLSSKLDENSRRRPMPKTLRVANPDLSGPPPPPKDYAGRAPKPVSRNELPRTAPDRDEFFRETHVHPKAPERTRSTDQVPQSPQRSPDPTPRSRGGSLSEVAWKVASPVRSLFRRMSSTKRGGEEGQSQADLDAEAEAQRRAARKAQSQAQPAQPGKKPQFVMDMITKKPAAEMDQKFQRRSGELFDAVAGAFHRRGSDESSMFFADNAPVDAMNPCQHCGTTVQDTLSHGLCAKCRALEKKAPAQDQALDVNSRGSTWSTFQRAAAPGESEPIPAWKGKGKAPADVAPPSSSVDPGDTGNQTMYESFLDRRQSQQAQPAPLPISRPAQQEPAGEEWTENRNGKIYVFKRLPDGRVKRTNEPTDDQWTKVIDGETYAYRKLANGRVQKRKLPKKEGQSSLERGESAEGSGNRYLATNIAGKKKLRELRQTTYSDPGNPFAAEDDVPDLPTMPAVDQPIYSPSIYSPVPQRSATPPMVRRGSAYGAGDEYVPPRAAWGRRTSMPSVPQSRPPMRQTQTDTDVRDTKFYGFYDDILSDSKGKNRRM